MKFEIHKFEDHVIVIYGEKQLRVDVLSDDTFGISFCVPANGDFSTRSIHKQDETHVVTGLKLSKEGVDALFLALSKLSNK